MMFTSLPGAISVLHLCSTVLPPTLKNFISLDSFFHLFFCTLSYCDVWLTFILFQDFSVFKNFFRIITLFFYDGTCFEIFVLLFLSCYLSLEPFVFGGLYLHFFCFPLVLFFRLRWRELFASASALSFLLLLAFAFCSSFVVLSFDDWILTSFCIIVNHIWHKKLYCLIIRNIVINSEILLFLFRFPAEIKIMALHDRKVQSHGFHTSFPFSCIQISVFLS